MLFVWQPVSVSFPFLLVLLLLHTFAWPDFLVKVLISFELFFWSSFVHKSVCKHVWQRNVQEAIGKCRLHGPFPLASDRQLTLGLFWFVQFVQQGVFQAELDEFLRRELAEDGYSGLEVHTLASKTRIIILATHTISVLGEKGRRIRELTSLVQKRFGFAEDKVEVWFCV